MMRIGRIFRGLQPALATLALLAPLCWAEAAHAQRSDLETAVKATFLNRFGSFAEWPPAAFSRPDAPVVVCVSGAATFARLVERAAAGERIGGRPVSVRSIGAVSAGSGCHILYAAGAGGQTVAAALAAVRGEPVLTVTDSAHGATRGIIHFVVVNERVRFHIDRNAAARNHVNLSSRLLSIALSVRGDGAP